MKRQEPPRGRLKAANRTGTRIEVSTASGGAGLAT